MTGSLRDWADHDIQRWHVGHRMFFVVVQSLIIALQRFDKEPTEDRLDDITELLAGAGVFMQYSADFVSGDYTAVRDSMADIDPDFSGAFSADHAAMLKAFPVVRQSGPQYVKAYARFQLALETVFKAHAFICRRFVGEEGSLANDQKTAWRTVYHKLSKRALKLAGIYNSRLSKPIE